MVAAAADVAFVFQFFIANQMEFGVRNASYGDRYSAAFGDKSTMCMCDKVRCKW